MIQTTRERRAAAVSFVAVCLALVLGFLASPAGAQDEDPYGGTTTTTGVATLEASCDLTLTQGRPGASVTATVNNVKFGATVRILFDGAEVGRGTAPMQAQSAGQPVLFGGEALARQAATTTTLAIRWIVPQASPGSHLVSAVGDDFTCLCNPDRNGQFSVLGASATQGGNGGPLPRTGIYVGLFLAVAVALLLAGRAALEASRRRRRQAERTARAEARHLAAASASGERSAE